MTTNDEIHPNDKIYLIPVDQASKIKEIPDELGLAEGDYPKGRDDVAWVNAIAIDGLELMEIKPDILEERDILPVYPNTANTIPLAPSLSIKALHNVSEAVALIRIGPGIIIPLGKLSEYVIVYPTQEEQTFSWWILPPPKSEYADEIIEQVYHQRSPPDSRLKDFLMNLGFDLE